MDLQEIAAFYRAYIDCLNRHDWDELHLYVSSDVRHNGRSLGLRGYQGMLMEDTDRSPISISRSSISFVSRR
ncbi:hypothetical protein SAMN03080610_00349 [Afifella marina DSM 2698]|uniref:SnoaL-like domain-containing protein n=1 Tax=Afifella marina DSM 2698 TaxID=1120955 RepID=A0A1G5MAX3_AFIMA|nr:hypothetical protein SAMN03080610_00349 [Afifella marina DSM 2698]